jgi:hypothetical protein
MKVKKITTAIAIIDLFLALVLTYMFVGFVWGIYALEKNIPNSFAAIFTYTTATNSLIIFTAELLILLVLTVIFAIGLLKKKKWVIIPRMILATIIVLYSIYNFIVGVGHVSIYTLYELLVAGFFGFMIITKKKFY